MHKKYYPSCLRYFNKQCFYLCRWIGADWFETFATRGETKFATVLTCFGIRIRKPCSVWRYVLGLFSFLFLFSLICCPNWNSSIIPTILMNDEESINTLMEFHNLKIIRKQYQKTNDIFNFLLDHQGCSYCGQLGHRITACPKLEAMQSRQATTVGRKDYLANNSADW